MNQAEKIMQTLSCLFASVTAFLFGQNLISAFKLLLALIVFDYITGILAAAAGHKLSSKVGFKGIIKKVMILILVSVGRLVDVYMVGQGNMFMMAVCVFFVSNEGMSIIENASRVLGKKAIPDKLAKYFKELSKDDDKPDDDKNEEEDEKDDENRH